MARAKRTDRAAARRRYRATLIDDQSQAPDGDIEDGEEPTAPVRSQSRAAASGRTGPAPRPSIVGAFRESFRPLDLRGDIAAIPSLLRHRAFLIPLALIVAATVLLVVTNGNDPISRTLSPYFLAPPPVAPVFLAGFLAPRASWILGGLLGVASSVALAVALSVPSFQATLAPTGVTITPATVLAQSLLVGTVGGAIFAAAAAWYKRFLALANPNRGGRSGGARPSDKQRRRGSETRPILARRR